MILTLKKFFVNKDNDYSEMTERVGARRIFLENIVSANVPNEEYTLDKLVIYCQSLIDGQRMGVPGLADGSWSISPDPSKIAEEDLVDYHYFPTFVALSTLIFSAGKYPDEIGSLSGLDKVLIRGFEFALTGNLEGYGFNTLFQQIEFILILGSGGCPSWLKDHPTACPALVERLKEIGQDYQKRLETGDTILSFGGDFKPQFTLAVKFLKPLME